MEVNDDFMTRTQLYKNFADNIEIERVRMKLTQKKMADALGPSDSDADRKVSEGTLRR